MAATLTNPQGVVYVGIAYAYFGSLPFVSSRHVCVFQTTKTSFCRTWRFAKSQKAIRNRFFKYSWIDLCWWSKKYESKYVETHI